MSKVRIPVNPKQVGRVGAYSMYVRAGEQIVRQRQNASNYGETASRTYAQQLRRVMWSNLVNQYRAIAFWQPRAYENIRAGQTDYNKFMSLNVNAASLPLTKQMASDGATIVTPVVVSQGSLPSPQTILEEDVFYLGLIIDATAGAAMATVGDFSAAVLASNPGYAQGDALCFVGMRNWLDLSDVPRAACDYAEVVLNPSDTTPLDSIGGGMFLAWSSDKVMVSFAFRTNADQPIVAATCIHTRRNVSALAVSTEKLVMLSEDIIDMYSGDEWLQECIDSYGVSTLVPLEPGKGDKEFKLVAAYRSFTDQGATLSVLVDKDGKVFADASGNTQVYNATASQYVTESLSGLPSEMRGWGTHAATFEDGTSTLAVTTDGAVFTFSKLGANWSALEYPRTLTYISYQPA